MSAQIDTLESIDLALAAYYKGLGVNYYNHDDQGRFMQYIIDQQLNDPDIPIENELDYGCNPNECAYTEMSNNEQFPIPPDVIIPDQQKEAYRFYILQFCFKQNQPPTDQYIKQYILPKVEGSLVQIPYDSKADDDDKEDIKQNKYDECIDLLLISEDNIFADNKESARYKAAKQIIEEIEKIINEHPMTNEPLIKMVSIFTPNGVQLINDLKVRIMLNGFNNKCYGLIRNPSFNKVFYEFIEAEMPHYRYNKKYLNKYMKGMDVMELSRWLGYCGYPQMIADILNDEVDEIQLYLDDHRINYDAADIQTIFAAFIVSIAPYLLTCNAINCRVVLVMILPTSTYNRKHGNITKTFKADIDHYINQLRNALNESQEQIEMNGNIVCYTINLSEDEDQSMMKIHIENIKNDVDGLSDGVYLDDFMKTKRIFTRTDNIGIGLHKFDKIIKCNLYNVYKDSVITFEPKDIFKWFPFLCKHKEYQLNESHYAIFLNYLEQNGINNWNDLDSEFEEIYIKFIRFIKLTGNMDLFKEILGIKRIQKKPFINKSNKFVSNEDINIFNQRSVKSLRNVIQQKFGQNTAEYLNKSTKLQLKKMNIFVVNIDNKQHHLSIINNALNKNKKTNVSLYTVIIPSQYDPSLWVFSKFITANQALLLYGISFEELPKAINSMHQLQKQFIPKNIVYTTQSEKHINMKLLQFVQDWNKKPNKNKLNIKQLQKCFVDNDINIEYFNVHILRCFRALLKRQCNITAIPAKALWEHIKPSSDQNDTLSEATKDDYYYIERDEYMEDNLDKLAQEIKDNTWNNIKIPKILTTKIIPGHIDEKFTNLYEYMQKYLHIYGDHVIKKYKLLHETMSITIINYNFHRDAVLVYVVDEYMYRPNIAKYQHKHYILSANQIYSKYSKLCYKYLNKKIKLPPSPTNIRLIPNPKQQEIIKQILMNIEETNNTITRTAWNDRQKIPIFGRKQGDISFTCTYTKKAFIKQIKDFIRDNMHHIRLEPVVRIYEHRSYNIDWVWIIKINHKYCTYHIGISVLTLSGEWHPAAIYLNIVDPQRLISHNQQKQLSQNEFHAMDNLQIGNDLQQRINQLQQQLNAKKTQNINNKTSKFKHKNRKKGKFAASKQDDRKQREIDLRNYDRNDIIWIVHHICNDRTTDKSITDNKESFLSYFNLSYIDGNKLMTMKRKHFSGDIIRYCNNKKLNGPSMKLWKKIHQFDLRKLKERKSFGTTSSIHHQQQQHNTYIAPNIITSPVGINNILNQPGTPPVILTNSLPLQVQMVLNPPPHPLRFSQSFPLLPMPYLSTLTNTINVNNNITQQQLTPTTNNDNDDDDDDSRNNQ